MSEEKGTESKEDEQATEDIQTKLDKAIGEGKTPKKRVRVVETSDAPVFTDKLIKAKGKKTYTVECVFDDDIYQIEVRRGMPMEFAVLLKLTAEVYALRRKRISEENQDAENQDAEKLDEVAAEKSRLREEEDRVVKQIIVASMVVRKAIKKTKGTDPSFLSQWQGWQDTH